MAACKTVLTKSYCYQMGFLESCYELNWRLQHSSQEAAVYPVKRHGRGCQQHEFALSAAKPRTGRGPAKIVRLSEQCTASAFLLPLDHHSKAAVLAFLQKRGKKLFQNISHT